MGLTQEDFSKLLKIPRNRLSNIENGNTSTSAHELHIIKNLLKIPQEELEVDKHTNKSDYNNSYFTNYELKAFLYLHSLNLSKEFLKLLIQLAKQAMKEGKE